MESCYALSGSPVPVIDSKGSAIAFAIMLSTELYGENKSRRVNYGKAQKLFDFICSNVKLPDVKTDGLGIAEALMKGIQESIGLQSREAHDIFATK